MARAQFRILYIVLDVFDVNGDLEYFSPAWIPVVFPTTLRESLVRQEVEWKVFVFQEAGGYIPKRLSTGGHEFQHYGCDNVGKESIQEEI